MMTSRYACGARPGLIELPLVLRHLAADEELLKLPLLLFQAPQGLLAIFVKGLVAARPRRRVPPSPGGTRRSIPSSHAPAFHSSAPHNECQGGKSKRPPDEEAEDHERNPGWFSQLIELCNDRHSGLAREC